MAEASGGAWFVYILRCADGSLYTGVTKDVSRRCEQHNAGTASRYTRCRRPVTLVYQEAQPSRSSALKREAAIKAMSRREKVSLIRCDEDDRKMLPLYEDPCFTFRFADDRIIPRFHLEGVEAGRRVAVYKIDPGTGERLGLLATATVGEGGWVDLTEPIIVRAGDAFIVVPEPA